VPILLSANLPAGSIAFFIFKTIFLNIIAKMAGFINLAYYKKEDWERFVNTAEDPEKLHATWKDWHNSYLSVKMSLISEGFIVRDFVVDIDDLLNYCKLKGIKNDTKARSQFVVKI
jgi:hypothetical protein